MAEKNPNAPLGNTHPQVYTNLGKPKGKAGGKTTTARAGQDSLAAFKPKK